MRISASPPQELHVDVDQTVSTTPPREGSSSESSSSSSSPMGMQPREESSDSAEENERRKGVPFHSVVAPGPPSVGMLQLILFALQVWRSTRSPWRRRSQS